MALNQEAEADTAVDTTPVSEETATDDSSSEAESTQDEPKKGYTARVSEAVNRAKNAEAEAASLRARLAELTQRGSGGGYNTPPYKPLEPLVNPGEEVTLEELNRRQAEREQKLLSQAAQIGNLQAQQALTLERINREAKELTRKYDVLDPNSDHFDRDLSDSVTEAAEAYVRANPTKSLEEFVDKQMRLFKRAERKQAKAEKAEVSKQQSQTAVRPTTTKPEDKKFEDLSIAEMEAKLGYAR